MTGVDRLDAGVGMGAAQDLAVEHPWQPHVSAVVGVARDLLRAVRTNGPFSYHIVFLIREHNIRLICQHCFSAF